MLTHKNILTTPIQNTVLTAASTAFPPRLSTSTPISEHCLFCEATAPCRALTKCTSLSDEIDCREESLARSRSSMLRSGNVKYQRTRKTMLIAIKTERVEAVRFLAPGASTGPEYTGRSFFGDIGQGVEECATEQINRTFYS